MTTDRTTTTTTTNLFAADKYISIIDKDINDTSAGCQGAIGPTAINAGRL